MYNSDYPQLYTLQFVLMSFILNVSRRMRHISAFNCAFAFDFCIQFRSRFQFLRSISLSLTISAFNLAFAFAF